MDTQPQQINTEIFAPELDDDFDSEVTNSLDLRVFWAMLRRNLLIIIAAVVLGFVLALAATLLATPRYTSYSSIQIDQETQRVLNVQDVEPATSYQDTDRFLQTQTDILRSRAMAISVAESLKLFGNAKFYTAMGAKLGNEAPTEQQQRELTLGLLQKNLGIVLPPNSRIVEISFESADPQMSADVVNQYAANFVTGNLQRKYNSSSYAREFLAQQLVEAKGKLEASERALNNYARSAGIISVGPASNGAAGSQPGTQSITTESLGQLNTALNTARANRIAAEQKWRSAAAGSAMNIPEVLQNQAIQELLRQRTETVADLSEESARHLEQHPRVEELRSQLAELDRQLGSLSSSIRSSIQQQYQSARGAEQSLETQVAGLKDATLGELDRSVRLNILEREADTNRTLYDGLLQRFKEVSATAGVTANNVAIIDRADLPPRPSSPKLLTNLAIGLFGGFVLAFLLVYLREQIDDAVRSPLDIERKLDLRVLGVIPRAAVDADIGEILKQPKEQLTEAYAALRTALMYSTQRGLPSALLVTSSQPSEGKSTTSYALATSIARLGKRVALVDADLRRPAMHKFFGESNKRGLSDLLVQNLAVEDVLIPIGGTGLTILPSGTIPPNPTELLSGGMLPSIVARLNALFDVVIFDGPPVIGLADAPLLAAQIEATLLVIESNSGYGGRTKGAIRRLGTTRSKLIGAALTKFEARKAGLGYEYDYYEYYSYGSDGSTKKDA
ncbi:MAG: hypothetical protein RLZZ08_1051 [Pseudomonadota bacterium]